MLRPIVEGLMALVLKPGGTTLEERRKMARVKCSFPVRVRAGVKYLQAKVTNLGVDGMLLRSAQVLPRGTEVSVVYQHQSSYEELSSVRGVVQWARRDFYAKDFMMGVRYEYTQKSWVSFVLGLLGLDDESVFQRRRYVRAEGLLPASLSVPGKMAPQRSWVLNLSLGGALVEAPALIGDGTIVQVELGPIARLPLLTLLARVKEGREAADQRNSLLSLEFNNLALPTERALGRIIVEALKQDAKAATT